MIVPVIEFWRCIPQVERIADYTMASAYAELTPYTSADIIQAIFSVAFPSWWEIRFAAWQSAMNAPITTIEIDGVELSIIYIDPVWAAPLKEAIIDGEIDLFASRCPSALWFPLS